MSLASSVALLVLLVASAAGWWSGQRLAAAANLGLVRRRAGWTLVAGLVATAAGAVHLGAAGSGPDAAGWVDLVSAAIVGLPVLAMLAVTVPRTVVIARRHGASDPLHWPSGQQRIELAAPGLVVPFAAALLGAMAVLLLPDPSTGGAGLHWWLAASAVVAATVLIARRQLHRQNRFASPISYADLRWTPHIERAGAAR